MSSCAATSRVIYFLLFHNPFHNHNVHTSRTHISLAISHCLLTWPSPACTTPVPICTHLHTPAHTCTLLNRYCAATFHRLTPTPEMISDHALADLANGLGIAAMAFIVLYHFVAVNGKRMEA
ncbi:hypothetical protein C347_06740 [Cryptococcus neoformans AD2-60a]|uniref:Dolichyl-diphosphooligosaccharide--protein glycosyltransferase subunit 4 n=1 Tax=Cryptococcus neoformans Tu259-1 TaxID=1230072 RepID=A0A854Q4F8_CRYNE|nr:hypothetical protein C347_06740 [Cryptococcus neoformans var. grubii AD2-60a]OWZ26447.1 hypothetical protein C353_06855 [Cryptococcus neoformans var. grubii AD1-83a]OXC81031.1 hypothetical protein C344_06715 [Cryptococcus neoformans var. grubii AD1-7a]OXG10278.1 hypothetical protein C361_06974 [Cryptococcus neoformans var. grubii Tu259-1]OXG30447.1 hypothetical protein C360_04819 [Cryptococcus neoformans var. grubii Bt15]OXG33021.1 hypothetical protein C359_06786 [Cryptococcus neoformans va